MSRKREEMGMRRKMRVCPRWKEHGTIGWFEIEERQRLADAVKHHQRDRNRAPSEPAGITVNVTFDNWKLILF
jgi:hypothetical protein